MSEEIIGYDDGGREDFETIIVAHKSGDGTIIVDSYWQTAQPEGKEK